MFSRELGFSSTNCRERARKVQSICIDRTGFSCTVRCMVLNSSRSALTGRPHASTCITIVPEMHYCLFVQLQAPAVITFSQASELSGRAAAKLRGDDSRALISSYPACHVVHRTCMYSGDRDTSYDHCPATLAHGEVSAIHSQLRSSARTGSGGKTSRAARLGNSVPCACVVIPTRLSMHVATAKTVTETVTSAQAHAAAARLCLAFSPQQTHSNTSFV